MKDLLLITPPFTQLNTPYPATAYLKGFLNTKKINSFQCDLGIEVILALFSKKGLTEIFNISVENNSITSENSQRIFALKNDYLKTIEPVIEFLQGKNQTFARQICSDAFLPQASRFEQLDDLNYAFGEMGLQDKAISEQLGISISAVRHRMNALLANTGLGSRAELAALAMSAGILPHPFNRPDTPFETVIDMDNVGPHMCRSPAA